MISNKNKNSKIKVIAICLSLIVAGSFGYVGYKQYFEPKTKESQYDELRELHKNNELDFQNDSINDKIQRPQKIEEDNSEDVQDSQEPVSSLSEPDSSSDVSVDNSSSSAEQTYSYTFEYIDRTIGWISIPGTSIDYPVLYLEGDNEFYLYHNYMEQYDSYGSIYLDGNQYIGAKNMTLYGHNINTYYDSMFKPLVNYENQNFFDEHPIVEFDYGADSSEWEVIGCMIIDLNNNHKSFNKFEFLDDNDFLDYGNTLLDNCIIRKDGVELQADDELLTLATCSYHTNNCRTVVICRRI